MMTAPFDTLALADALKATPLGKDGAEAVARAMSDIAMSNVATKADLLQVKHDLTVRMGGMIAAAVAVLGVIITMN